MESKDSFPSQEGLVCVRDEDFDLFWCLKKFYLHLYIFIIKFRSRNNCLKSCYDSKSEHNLMGAQEEHFPSSTE